MPLRSVVFPPNQYFYEGKEFWTYETREWYESFAGSKHCCHVKHIDKPWLGFYQYLRQCSKKELDDVLIRYDRVCRGANSSVNTRGCKISKVTLNLCWYCPSTECAFPRSRLVKRFGGFNRHRPQSLFEMVMLTKRGDWLGLIKACFGRDQRGHKLHTSHFCRAINGVCWEPSHATQEERLINQGPRAKHQAGSEVCDCADHGRDPCLVNGSNIPVYDSDGKIIRWRPNPLTYSIEATAARTSVSDIPQSSTTSRLSLPAAFEEATTAFISAVLNPQPLTVVSRSTQFQVHPLRPQSTSPPLFTSFQTDQPQSQSHTRLNPSHSAAPPETADEESWRESRMTLEEATQEPQETTEELKQFSCQIGHCRTNNKIFGQVRLLRRHVRRMHVGASVEDAVAASARFFGRTVAWRAT